MSTRVLRILAVAAVLSSGALTSGLVNVTDAGAVAKPKMVVTPAAGLSNGKSVTVSGSGFKPKDTVYITECLRTAKGPAGCDIATAIPVTISSKGVMAKTKFQVVTGKIGGGKCGTAASNLRSCAVSAGNISGGDTASFFITFAAPKK